MSMTFLSFVFPSACIISCSSHITSDKPWSRSKCIGKFRIQYLKQFKIILILINLMAIKNVNIPTTWNNTQGAYVCYSELWALEQTGCSQPPLSWWVKWKTLPDYFPPFSQFVLIFLPFPDFWQILHYKGYTLTFTGYTTANKYNQSHKNVNGWITKLLIFLIIQHI